MYISSFTLRPQTRISNKIPKAKLRLNSGRRFYPSIKAGVCDFSPCKVFKGNGWFGYGKTTFSILGNNPYNCFAKMVTCTLFKKPTDTNSNRVQRGQHHIVFCVSHEITKYRRKLYPETSAMEYVRSKARGGFCSLWSIKDKLSVQRFMDSTTSLQPLTSWVTSGRWAGTGYLGQSSRLALAAQYIGASFREKRVDECSAIRRPTPSILWRVPFTLGDREDKGSSSLQAKNSSNNIQNLPGEENVGAALGCHAVLISGRSVRGEEDHQLQPQKSVARLPQG